MGNTRSVADGNENEVKIEEDGDLSENSMDCDDENEEFMRNIINEGEKIDKIKKEQEISEEEQENRHFLGDYDSLEVLETYKFRFLIHKLPVRRFSIQEAAVTRFLMQIGLPESVTFRILFFTIDGKNPEFPESPEIFPESPLCNVEIMVRDDLRNILESRATCHRLAEHNHGLAEPIEVLRLPTDNRNVDELLSGVCALLNRGKSRKEFNAMLKEHKMLINEFQKTNRILSIFDVYREYRKNYLKVLKNAPRLAPKLAPKPKKIEKIREIPSDDLIIPTFLDEMCKLIKSSKVAHVEHKNQQIWWQKSANSELQMVEWAELNSKFPVQYGSALMRFSKRVQNFVKNSIKKENRKKRTIKRAARQKRIQGNGAAKK